MDDQTPDPQDIPTLNPDAEPPGSETPGRPGGAPVPPLPPKPPAPPTPGRPMPRPNASPAGTAKNPFLWILLIVGGAALAGSLLLNLILFAAVVSTGFQATSVNLIEKRIQGEGSDKVLVIDVAGAISRGGAVLFMPAGDSVSYVKKRLDVAREDDRIKAVILRVDSPGGTVTASDAIYKEILDFKKKTGKPVVSLMCDTAASGGYYVSMACDRVVAHEATLTGSIGVIMQFLNYKGLFEKYGLKWQTFTPGDADLKSIGAGDRDISEKEREVFQSMVEEMYEGFLEVVKAGRPKLSAEKVRDLADGRPYTGKQAHALGLVDVLGDLDTAIAEARNIKGFDADATVFQYETVTPFSSLFGMATGSPKPGTDLSPADIAGAMQASTAPKFYYLFQ